jgi:DNA replication licensing factor MCM2
VRASRCGRSATGRVIFNLTTPNPTKHRLLDEQLAAYVIGSHRRAQSLSGPENTKGTIKSSQMGYANKPLADGSSLHSYANSNETIPQDFLRKYLSHARDTCQPRLHSIDQDKISRLYADLRRESAICGGVPIAVRHLESLMRMAEAHVATPCYVLF